MTEHINNTESVGIIYFAKGEGYRREAVRSAKQTNQIMPNVPIVLFTDEPTDAECFFKEIIHRNDFSKRDKAKALLESPFKRNIYLDSDIYLDESITKLFNLLEEFDMAVAADPKDHHLVSNIQNDIPDSFPEFNTGVIVYKKNKTVLNMLNRWEENCEIWHTADQPSFRKSLYDSKVRFIVLPRRYNYMYRAPAQVNGKVKVFHGTLRDHRGSDVSLHELDIGDAKDINKYQFPRVSFKLEDQLVVNPPQSLVGNFLYYLMYTNIRTTSKKIQEVIYDRIISKPEKKLREIIFQIRAPESIELKTEHITAQFSSTDASGVNWDYRDDFYSEKIIVEDLLDEIEKGDVFYDIGANVGIYSCFAGKVVGNGQIISFEPHPGNYQSLKKNCDLNSTNSKLYEVALGSKTGEAYLEPMGSTGHVVRDEYQPEREKIRIVPGDQFINQHSLPHPDICKIDVEGAELEVIKGLQNILSQENCRKIYCEIHPEKLENGDDSIKEITHILSRLGYRIEYLQNRSGNIFIKANKL